MGGGIAVKMNKKRNLFVSKWARPGATCSLSTFQAPLIILGKARISGRLSGNPDGIPKEQTSKRYGEIPPAGSEAKAEGALRHPHIECASAMHTLAPALSARGLGAGRA